MKKISIADRIDTFIRYKRSLGYVYDTQERYLRHYQHHMEERFPDLLLPDKPSTDSFLEQYRPAACIMPWPLCGSLPGTCSNWDSRMLTLSRQNRCRNFIRNHRIFSRRRNWRHSSVNAITTMLKIQGLKLAAL